MGARLVVKFGNDENPPMVYLHHGGKYAEQVQETMSAFITELEKLSDKRLDDAPYLAAKFLAFHAHKYNSTLSPIDFLRIGIVTDEGYGDTVARMRCDGTFDYDIEKSIDND